MLTFRFPFRYSWNKYQFAYYFSFPNHQNWWNYRDLPVEEVLSELYIVSVSSPVVGTKISLASWEDGLQLPNLWLVSLTFLAPSKTFLWLHCLPLNLKRLRCELLRPLYYPAPPAIDCPESSSECDWRRNCCFRNLLICIFGLWKRIFFRRLCKITRHSIPWQFLPFASILPIFFIRSWAS